MRLKRTSMNRLVGKNFRRCRPVTILVIHVIPRHFIDADCKQRFKPRVNPLPNQPGYIKLVDKEDRCMTVIKNQWMTKRVGGHVKGRVILQAVEQALIKSKGLVK